ncbi:methyltransferase domain-containing protein [bacterium]|nr:methyltransferase domain-containing protein [bacterium]
MKYFFVLGSNTTLSIAELTAVLPSNAELGFPALDIAVVNLDKPLDAGKLIKKLGGTIKIGQVEKTVNRYIDQTSKIIKMLKPDSGKFKYGFSYYGPGKFNSKILAMKIKNHLRENGISCRWVTSKERTLSSVVVEQNKLTGPGLEIVLIADAKNLHIGKTLAVQPFKELSYRDYGRPSRDNKSGMLPPKLAQIMINLSGLSSPLLKKEGAGGRPDEVILDPFCGSGTILAETILMGYKNIIGSDVSKKAVDDTRKNIKWIKNKFSVADFNFQIYQHSATEITKIIKPNSVDVIVTEPFLGPQRGKINIKQTVIELNELYSRSLKEFKKILKSDGRVVMIWPAFAKSATGKPTLITIMPSLSGFKIQNPIPTPFKNNKSMQLTTRNTIIYGRTGQKVWREIVILAPKITT